jgi:hypothetical protein
MEARLRPIVKLSCGPFLPVNVRHVQVASTATVLLPDTILYPLFYFPPEKEINPLTTVTTLYRLEVAGVVSPSPSKA